MNNDNSEILREESSHVDKNATDNKKKNKFDNMIDERNEIETNQKFDNFLTVIENAKGKTEVDDRNIWT